MATESIRIRGVRVHNLRNLSLDLPKRSLVVLTGPSGSGKSSLAFDTLFAEGQRRYVDSLSVYARQFVAQLEKPDCDELTGLSPTVSIEQKSVSHNPRSTVGTMTEIHDHLRLLYARLGEQQCHQCGDPVGVASTDRIVQHILAQPEGTRLQILAPLVRNRKGEFRELFESLRRRGLTRARIDGAWHELDAVDRLRKTHKHDIDAVVDRLILRPDVEVRAREAVDLALVLGDGALLLLHDSGPSAGSERLFSTQRVCHRCQISFPPLTQQSFSFNSPLGRCPTCEGIGTVRVLDMERVVPDPSRSIREGALAPMMEEGAFGEQLSAQVARVLKAMDADPQTPWHALPGEVRTALLDGAPRPLMVPRNRGPGLVPMRWKGVRALLEERAADRSEDDELPASLGSWFSLLPCQDCRGGRLRPESAAVRFAGHSLVHLNALPLQDALTQISAIQLEGQAARIGDDILEEIRGRLAFLIEVGVPYLTLDRPGPSLSGGESQRVRLAGQLGSRLTGVLYVLDEPSIGLHQRDNQRLIQMLLRLRDQGNTVLVVEHDRDTMLAADWLVDFGPGAGRLGGTIQAAGTPADVIAAGLGVTAQYLQGKVAIETPAIRRTGSGNALRIRDAWGHNLQHVDVDIPLGTFTCLTGVSGAGKSTLLFDILVPAALAATRREASPPLPCGGVEGLEHLDKVIEIDQQPIGRTPRSNPATYIKLLDDIRILFSQLPEAQIRGYGRGRFSFNVRGGRCETCSGAGRVRIDMRFMSDAWVTCSTCRGRRFNDATLRVRYRGHSIADVLDMTVEQAAELFVAHPRIERRLRTLLDVGLGYITLGQSSTTLSGGEAQRIKLARELSRVATGGTLYVLDEPSTGLHFDDIRRLLQVVYALVEAGNTVVMIEHNLDIIRCADHVIDLGPEGGGAGGRVVAAGTPEEVAQAVESHTGFFLAQELGVKRAG